MITVYALTDPGALPAGLRGIGGAPLDVHVFGDVAAVWSAATGPPPVRPEHLWEHEDVLDTLLADRAVLPVRFGTVLDDHARLETLLGRNADVITAALDDVRGLVEIGVRVLDAEPGSDAPPADTPSNGRDYLVRRLAGTRATHTARRARAEALHAPLAQCARRATRRPPRRGEVLTAAYLVAPTEVDTLVDRARELDAAHPDVRVVCTGGWPPHSFVPRLELEEVADA